MNMRMMRFRDRGGVSVVIIIMNRLSQLLRRPLEEPHLRKQISGVNMQRRKETRRLKKLNTYSREFTGEQNQHGWFTPRRYKALGLFLQSWTLPIKADLKKEISQKMVEDAHWNYYVYRNHYNQLAKQKQMYEETVTQQEISNLPAHFRDDLTAKEEEEEPIPKIINPLFVHNGQYNVYMPQDERQRLNLLLKIDNPPENKDQDEDED